MTRRDAWIRFQSPLEEDEIQTHDPDSFEIVPTYQQLPGATLIPVVLLGL